MAWLLRYRGYCGIANTRSSIIRLLIVYRDRWNGRARECRDWPAGQACSGAGGAKRGEVEPSVYYGRYRTVRTIHRQQSKKRVAQEGRLGA